MGGDDNFGDTVLHDTLVKKLVMVAATFHFLPISYVMVMLLIPSCLEPLLHQCASEDAQRLSFLLLPVCTISCSPQASFASSSVQG